MVCSILFIYSLPSNEMFIFTGKSHCCISTFTEIIITLPYSLHFLGYIVRNFHSNWFNFPEVTQEMKRGCFLWHHVIQRSPRLLAGLRGLLLREGEVGDSKEEGRAGKGEEGVGREREEEKGRVRGREGGSPHITCLHDTSGRMFAVIIKIIIIKLLFTGLVIACSCSHRY